MTGGRGRRRTGFTLIEILLTVALVAVLASLATPAYRQFINRAHRADVIARMMHIASCQERLRARNGTYDTAQCLPSNPPRYELAYAEGVESGYTVLARPHGPQAGDPCGTLILEHTGGRRISMPGIDPLRCWSGR